MNLLIISLLCIIPLNLAILTCSGQCNFRSNAQVCIPTVAPPFPYNIAQCNPIFKSGCPSNCIKGTSTTCDNNPEHINPDWIILCPQGYITYDAQTCVPDPAYALPPECPLHCFLDKHTMQCVSEIKDIYCQPTPSWKCPNKCFYNTTSNSCESLSVINQCAINRHVVPPLCPNGCEYFDGDCCAPSDFCDKHGFCGDGTKNVCKLTRILYMSKLYNGDYSCINTFNNTCGYIDQSCPFGCIRELTDNRCIPAIDEPDKYTYYSKITNICDATIQMSCPDKYIIDYLNLPSCDRYNRNKICSLSPSVIQFPSAIFESLKDIKCIYSGIKLDCTNIQQTVSVCPNGCQLNAEYNTCVSSGVICGSVGIICPLNYTAIDQEGNCYSPINLKPSCQENYRLEQIQDQSANIVTRCLPNSYYSIIQ